MSLTVPIDETEGLPEEAAEGPARPGGGGPGARAETVGVRRGGWFVRITLLVVAVIWLVPAIGVLITSFRPEALVEDSGWWTALGHPFRSGEWTLDNYRTALDQQGFSNAFLNSLAVAIPATVIPIAIAAFAAYAFSWMNFRGRHVMFVAVVGLMVVPLQMALIPILKLYTDGATIGGLTIFPDLDLAGTFLGVWLAHAAFGLPLATYLLRNYIGALPSSIIESAKIDGADHFKIFWRLVVPLSVPALASFAIFQFLWVWNDLLVSYVFLGGTRQNRVLTIALANLVGARGENWHLLTAAGFLSMTLPLAVFFSLQRYFIRGLTAGAVKG
jgi:alpha-glucoside transport system permease protein